MVAGSEVGDRCLAVLADLRLFVDDDRDLLAGEGLAVTSVRDVAASLEDVFLEVLDRAQRSRAA